MELSPHGDSWNRPHYGPKFDFPHHIPSRFLIPYQPRDTSSFCPLPLQPLRSTSSSALFSAPCKRPRPSGPSPLQVLYLTMPSSIRRGSRPERVVSQLSHNHCAESSCDPTSLPSINLVRIHPSVFIVISLPRMWSGHTSTPPPVIPVLACTPFRHASDSW